MASQIFFSQTQTFPANRHPSLSRFVKNRGAEALIPHFRKAARRRMSSAKLRTAGFVLATAAAAEMPKKRRSGDEPNGFVDEMRAVSLKLHPRDQVKEGEKEQKENPVASWKLTVEGCLRFLVDSKLVYDTLEIIVAEAPCPWYAEFRNTGLERSEKLAKDLEWFKEQGYAIPELSSPGPTYSQYLKELSEKDPHAFICHFYNIYFGHTVGGRIIGKKVTEMILDGKKLEFYIWDGDLRQLLQNVRDKLNLIANNWSREEKNHCLNETEKSFQHLNDILQLILS